MNYNDEMNIGQGKPRRKLTSKPRPPATPVPMQQNPYAQSQQAPVNNGMTFEYGFNVQEQQQQPAYGFNTPVQSYPHPENHVDQFSTPEYSSRQFATPQFPAHLLATPVVANMAAQYGTSLVGTGKQQLERYVPVTALKYYFAVNTDYVFAKLALLFFPFTHRDWSVKYEQDVPLQPRYEKNAPDMYIPMMAFLTYVVLAGLVLGTQERFTPEHLGILASSALAWGLIELVVHTVTLYVMNLETSLSTLDLLAYCGYKYVGINAAFLASLVFRRFGYYVLLLYFSASFAFFLIRSLKLRVIPQNQSAYTASGNKRRLYFILFVSGIQPVLMWWLSYDSV